MTLNGTTIFQNGFELDAIGNSPATPLVGDWFEVVPSDPTKLGVYGPASGGPGAVFGDHYAHMLRPDQATGGRMLGTFTLPIADGDQLHFETWAWIGGQPPKDYELFMSIESPGRAAYVDYAATGTASGSVAGAYRPLLRGGNMGPDLADIVFFPQTWHKWSFDYVVGAPQITIGVDGATQVRNMDPGDTVANPLSVLRIATSNWPTELYFDGPQAAAIPGDVNHDGFVDIFDVNVVSANWGSPGGPTGDANGDGNVDIFDVNLISANWAPPSPPGGAAVPEPSSIVLAVLALTGTGCALIRRRKERLFQVKLSDAGS